MKKDKGYEYQFVGPPASPMTSEEIINRAIKAWGNHRMALIEAVEDVFREASVGMKFLTKEGSCDPDWDLLTSRLMVLLESDLAFTCGLSKIDPPGKRKQNKKAKKK